MKSLSIFAGVAAVFVTASAHATLVNFEDQPAGTCCFATAGPSQSLSYNIGGGQMATFAGGVILTDESGTVSDVSNVYATASGNLIAGADPSLKNPMTITFTAPISNFQFDILNALPGNYEVSDNAGHTDFFTVASSTATQTVDLATTGTLVDLTFLNSSTGGVSTSWDFAIDNVNFTTASTPPTNVPEPATWTMLILGLAMTGFVARRRNVKARVEA